MTWRELEQGSSKNQNMLLPQTEEEKRGCGGMKRPKMSLAERGIIGGEKHKSQRRTISLVAKLSPVTGRSRVQFPYCPPIPRSFNGRMGGC